MIDLFYRDVAAGMKRVEGLDLIQWLETSSCIFRGTGVFLLRKRTVGNNQRRANAVNNAWAAAPEQIELFEYFEHPRAIVRSFRSR